MLEQIKKEIIVNSGDIVQQSGYYVLVKDPAHDALKCPIPEIAYSGIYFAKGYKAPDLITCSHKIKWELDF